MPKDLDLTYDMCFSSDLNIPDLQVMYYHMIIPNSHIYTDLDLVYILKSVTDQSNYALDLCSKFQVQPMFFPQINHISFMPNLCTFI